MSPTPDMPTMMTSDPKRVGAEREPGRDAAPRGEHESFWTRSKRWSTNRLLRGLPEWRLFEDEATRASAVERMDAEIDRSSVFSWSVIAVSIAATVLVNASFALVPIMARGTGLITGKTPLWLTLGVIAVIVALGVACVLWAWRRGVAKGHPPASRGRGSARVPALRLPAARPARGALPGMRNGHRPARARNAGGRRSGRPARHRRRRPAGAIVICPFTRA
ncbi:MAG: hypothetical protein AB7K52_07345 [Phycisphaerales bacterium]